jgi:uncharacterized protein YdeI (YjbR/CyaY-like superfamily)
VEPDEPPVTFATPRAWERWLERNHATADHVWLRLAKKGSDERAVSYAQALEGALCYGWIDGQAWSIDERSYAVRFSPRRARSRWSKPNRDRVAELIRLGRMRPAGLEQIERAKRDGRWGGPDEAPAGPS